MKKISITVDVEQDCPPMLQSMQGVEKGLPKLLELFWEEQLRVTFFVTGKVAELYPDSIKRIVDDGHEIGCHGYAHERFDHMSLPRAEEAINKGTKILRRFDENMVSFRAPNLKFPENLLDLLEREGYRIDSSTARYKPPFPRGMTMVGKIIRVPASITSSIIRLPPPLTYRLLPYLKNPVLFVHPWEFVNMKNEKVRYDCKFNTGAGALKNLQQIIRYFKSHGYKFMTISDMVDARTFPL